ncbi:MAG: hypothetical protein JWP25_1800 [Bradyrhizobium sp.]|nr:hypothetical protein [Bradyrhizobium sp.]
MHWRAAFRGGRIRNGWVHPGYPFCSKGPTSSGWSVPFGQAHERTLPKQPSDVMSRNLSSAVNDGSIMWPLVSWPREIGFRADDGIKLFPDLPCQAAPADQFRK